MNEQIVDDALADIALHPEIHNQRTFGHITDCGTTYCLAGFIAVRAGYQLVSLGHDPHDNRWLPVHKGLPRYNTCAEIAQVAAEMNEDEACEMFINSYFDDLKELTARWNRLTGREV